MTLKQVIDFAKSKTDDWENLRLFESDDSKYSEYHSELGSMHYYDAEDDEGTSACCDAIRDDDTGLCHSCHEHSDPKEELPDRIVLR